MTAAQKPQKKSIKHHARKPLTTAAAEWIAPDKLKPWKDNPRLNEGAPVARVAESIKRFGFGAPIVARAANLEIIAGHTRWKAARQLKLPRVPVRLLDVSESDAHVLALTDNRHTELTPWSSDLGDLLSSFDPLDVAIAGWTNDDVAKLAPHNVSFEASGELDLNKVVETQHKCPKCGHDF